MSSPIAESAPNWEAAERFRPTADLLPVLIWIAGTDKLCTWFNRTWLEFVGRAMEQELGNGWAENVHPDDFDRCLQTYVSAFEARVSFRMEYRLRCFDGEYQWVLDEGRPMHNDGVFAGYIGCCLLIDDQKKALERERRVTQALQTAFLPPFLPKVDGVEFDACYRPSEREAQVGGDWYDVFVLPDGRIALSIGDVFGHGLDAAGDMIRLRETMRAVSGLIPDDPAAILRSVDQIFQTSHPNAIATAVHAIYDASTRRLLVANAGHPPPVLVRDGVATLLDGGGLPLGVANGEQFTLAEHVLQAGDAFVLYTDGLVEVDRDLLAGTELLLAALTAEPLDAAALVSKLTQNGQQDDVAFLALNVCAEDALGTWRFEAEDARYAEPARYGFIAYLRRRGVPRREVDSAAIVFGELVANVVRHAPGPIEIELSWNDGNPMLFVRDRGPSLTAMNATLPSELWAESGRGLYLVSAHATLEEVRPRADGGNEICARLQI